MAPDAIGTCNSHAASGSWSAPGDDLPRSTSQVAIEIPGHSEDAFSAKAVDEDSFRCLVKEKREDCFRRLGGSSGIATKLNSQPEAGIAGDGNDVTRRKEFGENTCPKPRPKRFISHVLDALSDVSVVALLGSAAVSLGFGVKDHGLKDGWYDGASIFLAVFVVSGVTAVISYSQAKMDHKLATESVNLAVTVVHAARRQEVSVFDLVVGDVVILKIGDAVPADGVFLDDHGLQVDESSLTGHPGPIEIDAAKNPFLASGVKVLYGHGSMLVTAVGTDTTAWSILSTLKLNTHPAPLEERLESLISNIGMVAVAVALVTFTVTVARHFTNSSTGKPLLIEKGVPLAVTLMATFSMKRMVKDNSLVHSLSALETMASVTVICTDMTGMLTLNRMEVTEFWVGTARPRTATAMASSIVRLLCQGVGLNTTGSVYKLDNVSQPEISGSPMEKALVSWAAADLGMDAAALKRNCKVVHVEAFNSDEKPSHAIIRDKATRVLVAHWRGSAEVVLAMCSMYMDTDATVRELGVEQRNKLEEVIRDMVASGLRCLGFAYKMVDDTEQSQIHHLEGLTLLGLVGLKDTCRPEVNATIEDCTKACIAVKMLTGNNILTALAIANESGIISRNDPDGVVIEGHEFRAMSGTRQLQIVDRIRVMASYRPQDKLLLVKRLKHKGHVVAVTTGEGTNDAAALKEADVVLSMADVTLVLQVVTVEVLARFVGTTKLGLGQWGFCLAIAAVSWPVGCAVKFIIPLPVGSS